MFRKILVYTLFLGLLSHSLLAALLVKQTVADLVNGSETIVIGKVEDLRSRFDVNSRGDELIYTDVAVRGEPMKGQKSEVYVFTVEGGVIGDTELIATHMPTFTKGEEVVVFLYNNPYVDKTLPTVFGELQGKFSVDKKGLIKGRKMSLMDLKQTIQQELEK